MIPKRMYFYWGNETISFLRYMTVKSFIFHNPDFETILITKENKTKLNNDKLFIEESDSNYFNGKDYTKELMSLDITYQILEKDYIEIAELGLPDSSIDDILGWYILSTKGGFKADMDILFTHPINYDELKDIDVSVFMYNNFCAIGFLFGTPNQFYDVIYQNAKIAKIENYQSIGGELMRNVLLRFGGMFSKTNMKIMRNSMIYPFVNTCDWKIQLDRPFEKDVIYEVDKNIFGIHWFGGWTTSRDYNSLLTQENYMEYKNTISYYINEVLK